MKKDDFSKLVKSLKQAVEIKKGRLKSSRVFTYAAPDVKGIRRSLRVSQGEFAYMIGVSPRTVQNWEQGRRIPRGPARALLRVAAKNPQTILEALHSE